MRTIFTLIIAFSLNSQHVAAQNSWGLDNSFGINRKVITALTPLIMQV